MVRGACLSTGSRYHWNVKVSFDIYADVKRGVPTTFDDNTT